MMIQSLCKDAGAGSLGRKAVRFKLAADGEDGTFQGYASVFDQIDTYGDVVAPGAYANTLARHAADGTRPKLLLQHDSSKPIGTWLEMREDGTGLWCKGRLLLDVAAAREAHVLLKAGELDGLSIGYDIVQERYAAREEYKKYCVPFGGNYGVGGGVDQVRVLVEVHLAEVSLVTWGACPGAMVDVATVKAPAVSQDTARLAALSDALGRRAKALAAFR